MGDFGIPRFKLKTFKKGFILRITVFLLKKCLISYLVHFMNEKMFEELKNPFPIKFEFIKYIYILLSNANSIGKQYLYFFIKKNWLSM